MTEEEAKAILDKKSDTYTKRDPNDRNRIIQGLVLLASVDPTFDMDTEIATVHDQIYAGSFARTVNKMTEDQILQMRRWAWFCSEESWSHFA